MRTGGVLFVIACAFVVATAFGETTVDSKAPTLSRTARGGTVIIEFDPAALERFGVGRNGNNHLLAFDRSLPLNVEAAESNFRASVQGGAVTGLSGFLQTVGDLPRDLDVGDLAAGEAAGRFAVVFTRFGATVQERQAFYRNFFDVTGQDLGVRFDAASGAVYMTGPLTISDGFARDLLKDPSAAGQVIGTLVIDIRTATSRSPAGESPATGGAGTVPRAAIGPDIIVSYVGSSGTSLSEYQGVNGISAYAMSTTSCNLGDTVAGWSDCTDGNNPVCRDHPVIAQNMYRLKNGRFEMIGMSWLKHGWCGADASGANCQGPCQQDGTCDSLGIGCTDTYGASLNADQMDLGPRSEVNGFTGQFPYPYILNWNQIGGNIFKRLQIKNTDLNPSLNSGALYVAEVHYVHPDEQRPVRFNNASWRQVVVGGLFGSPPNQYYDLSFTGNPVPQKAAIEAWTVLDTGVTMVDAFVPDEGRFEIGYKVTDNGNGTWHYEYALYNMNSDRSGGSFSVPVSAGTAISSVGFHDVDYHSGEPYDLTDWDQPANGSAAGPSLVWSVHPYPSDPANANALRWGTTYNYRFDANRPPVSGTATIGLFKSGTPADITATVQVPQPCLTPTVDPMSSTSTVCGSPWSSAAPTASGTPPLTWSLIGSPPAGMTIDSGTGVVSWPSPLASDVSYTVTIQVSNGCGNASTSFSLTVARGDYTGDGMVDAGDVADFTNDLLGSPIRPCAGDLNEDGRMDGLDVQEFVDRL